MDNFDNLIQGNILILGEKTKEQDIYKKLTSKTSRHNTIFFNKCDNVVISNIIIRSSVDFNLIDFSNFRFSKILNVYRGTDTIYNTTILTKYLVDNLDYQKQKDTLFMTQYYRETFKIVYLYDTYNKLIQNIKQNIDAYCKFKKYSFKSINIEKENKTKQCFSIVENEIKDCNKLLILYNYSFIQDHTKTLSTFLGIHLSFDTENNITMFVDNIYGKWFDNFIIINNNFTFDLITEIKYILKKNTLSEYDLSKYFKNNSKIKVNNFLPVFNATGDDAKYISTYNSIQNKDDLENNLNFYINNYKFQPKNIGYPSIYLKEYVYKFNNSSDIHKMKFGFRGKLEISKTKHIYKELSSQIYELVIDKIKYIIYFSDNYESFKGVEINTDNPSKIEGVLIII